MTQEQQLTVASLVMATRAYLDAEAPYETTLGELERDHSIHQTLLAETRAALAAALAEAQKLAAT